MPDLGRVQGEDESTASSEDDTTNAVGDQVERARPTPTRVQLWLIVGPLIVLFVGAQIGDAFAPTLVTENPLLLIVLNSRNRNLILAVNQIDPVVFFVVATLRLLASDPLFYLLGYFYGDAAVHWMERRSSTIGRGIRSFEQYFKTASYPLVAIAPNNLICLLAGSSGMSPPVFFALNLGGTIVRVLLIIWLGEQFEAPIDWLLDFIKEYRWYLMAVTVTIVAVTAYREFRQGTSEISGLTHLAEGSHAADENDGADAGARNERAGETASGTGSEDPS